MFEIFSEFILLYIYSLLFRSARDVYIVYFLSHFKIGKMRKQHLIKEDVCPSSFMKKWLIRVITNS